MNEEQVMKATRIASLITKHMQNKLSRTEREELYTWITESSENYLLFESLTNMNTLGDALKYFYSPGKETPLNKLLSKLRPGKTTLPGTPDANNKQ